MYIEAVLCVSLSVSMTFRGRNVFFRFFLSKKIFFHHFIPKKRKKRHVADRGLVVCFFLKLIFLYFIACFNIVVTWGG